MFIIQCTVVLNFESTDEILNWSDHTNETSFFPYFHTILILDI